MSSWIAKFDFSILGRILCCVGFWSVKANVMRDTQDNVGDAGVNIDTCKHLLKRKGQWVVAGGGGREVGKM